MLNGHHCCTKRNRKEKLTFHVHSVLISLVAESLQSQCLVDIHFFRTSFLLLEKCCRAGQKPLTAQLFLNYSWKLIGQKNTNTETDTNATIPGVWTFKSLYKKHLHISKSCIELLFTVNKLLTLKSNIYQFASQSKIPSRDKRSLYYMYKKIYKKCTKNHIYRKWKGKTTH